MTADNLQVERFEFLLQRDGHEAEWFRVRGHRGCICDACVPMLNHATEQRLESALATALRCIVPHERRGQLRVVHGPGSTAPISGRVIAAQAVARNGTVRCVVWRDQP